jgi:predicted permease
MAGMLAIALVPIFFGLLLGYFAGITKSLDNVNVRTLVSFVMNFALPCMLFLAIVQAPRELLWGQWRVILIMIVVLMTMHGITFLLSRRLMGANAPDSAVLALTIAFPNFTAVGVPLLDALYGAHSGVTLAAGIATGAMTISPITLAVLEGCVPSVHEIPTSVRMRRAILRAVRRPVVWAPAAGLLAACLNMHLAPWAARSLSVMGMATGGAGLFLTGLIVSAQRFEFDWGVALATLAKNILQPAFCLALAVLFALPVEMTRWVVLMMAIPCGFFGLVFGKGFGSTPISASSSLVISYVVGIATLAGWLVVLGHLH